MYVCVCVYVDIYIRIRISLNFGCSKTDSRFVMPDAHKAIKKDVDISQTTIRGTFLL